MNMGEFLHTLSIYDNPTNIVLFYNIAEMMEVIDKYGDCKQYTRIGFSSEADVIENVFSSSFLEKKVIEFRAMGKDSYAVCLECDVE